MIVPYHKRNTGELLAEELCCCHSASDPLSSGLGAYRI